MTLALLGFILLVAAVAAGILYHFKGYPKVLRVQSDTVSVGYKLGSVTRIIYWFEKRVLIWSKDDVEILQKTFNLYLQQEYCTKDGVAIQIGTTIYAFTEKPQLLPLIEGDNWNENYARTLAAQAVEHCIFEVDMKTLTSNVVEIVAKMNAFIIAESEKHPFTLNGVKHAFGELNKVSIYKTEFQIRQSAKHLKETQSEEATA